MLRTVRKIERLEGRTPMLFVLICKDKPGEGLARRVATRPAHLAYLESLGDKLRCGGAMLNDETSEPRGSLLLIEVDDLEAAKAIAKGDPYWAADVFESVEVIPWRQAVGAVQIKG
jgi:uncharacterized protein